MDIGHRIFDFQQPFLDVRYRSGNGRSRTIEGTLGGGKYCTCVKPHDLCEPQQYLVTGACWHLHSTGQFVATFDLTKPTLRDSGLPCDLSDLSLSARLLDQLPNSPLIRIGDHGTERDSEVMRSQHCEPFATLRSYVVVVPQMPT